MVIIRMVVSVELFCMFSPPVDNERAWTKFDKNSELNSMQQLNQCRYWLRVPEEEPVTELRNPKPFLLCTFTTRRTRISDSTSMSTVGKINAREPISNGIAIANQLAP